MPVRSRKTKEGDTKIPNVTHGEIEQILPRLSRIDSFLNVTLAR